MVAAPPPVKETKPFAPGLDWKPEPVMVTGFKTPPMLGVILVICGGGTVKLIFVLLPMPPTATVTGPVTAAAGTVATMLVLDQLVMVAVCPLKVTVPGDAVKFVPAMVTAVPAFPVAGATLLTIGATVNAAPLLGSPPSLTTTLPVVAPLGTATAMLVADQLVMAAV